MQRLEEGSGAGWGSGREGGEVNGLKSNADWRRVGQEVKNGCGGFIM